MCQCNVKGCTVIATHPYQLSVHLRGAHPGQLPDILATYPPPLRQELEKYLQGSGPDISAEDERILAGTDISQQGSWDLSAWLAGGIPICREERQYAHMLAAKLAACKPPVEQIYFEPSFMRDLFRQNREDFLRQLYQHPFCTTETTDYHRHPNHNPDASVRARWMMNAKPDIGLLLNVDGEYTLHFIECKYLSPEDRYRDRNGTYTSQTELQGEILSFLCGPLGLSYQARPVKRGRVFLLEFTANSAGDPVLSTANGLLTMLLSCELPQYRYRITSLL